MVRENRFFKHVIQYRIRYTIIAVVLIVYWFSLPKTLFKESYSTTLYSSNGTLLSASIAPDGQWRFPLTDSVPEKFAKALITFEDKRFYSHPGVDVLSLGRAIRQNLKAGRVVSGGSTITMQVIRLAREQKSRTIFEKLVESILATRLELARSKDEVIALYAAHAPFGGNVVGLQAACWRYFGRSPRTLSWAEAAMLAVLPNAPSLIHPGKNRSLLKQKRDRLLDKLHQNGSIDELTLSLAKEEPIPDEPLPLPKHARHLLSRAKSEGMSERRIVSTIDDHLQLNVEEIVSRHHGRLVSNQIHNAAALVLEVQTGKVLAYVGNVESAPEHGGDVDMTTAKRSTGSILKPFLYAALQDEGAILPKSLIEDAPIIMEGFSPKNFSRKYDGAVAADQALIRSLNVPAVNQLQEFHHHRFYRLLKDLGMSTLSHPADHYGLSLILGGAEGTLYDISGMYASMARTLNNYFLSAGENRYDRGDIHPPSYTSTRDTSSLPKEPKSMLNASSIFLTFQALEEVYRPGEETGWRYFSSSRRIAWKTGTSFGFRDGWAVGVTPEYVVGVWVGNADNEGRPGLTGTDAASPLMFDIFSQLPTTTWFDKPLGELTEVVVCKSSGHRISANCSEPDTILIDREGLNSAPCPYHKLVHLTPDRKYRLHGECAAIEGMVHVPWFVLPPVQEFYFKQHNLSYRQLPPYRDDCADALNVATMDLLYPRENSQIFIPRELDGTVGNSVFQLAHRNPDSKVYWHLDGTFIGTTQANHHFPVKADAGKHILTIVDDKGNSIERQFEVLSKI